MGIASLQGNCTNVRTGPGEVQCSGRGRQRRAAPQAGPGQQVQAILRSGKILTSSARASTSCVQKIGTIPGAGHRHGRGNSTRKAELSKIVIMTDADVRRAHSHVCYAFIPADAGNGREGASLHRQPPYTKSRAAGRRFTEGRSALDEYPSTQVSKADLEDKDGPRQARTSQLVRSFARIGRVDAHAPRRYDRLSSRRSINGALKPD